MKADTLTFVAALSLVSVLLLENRRADRLDAEEVPARTKLVDMLVSSNKAPVLQNNRAKPEFDANFDFPEQKRIWSNIKGLFKSAAEDWDSIAKGISREDYCVTVRTFNSSKYNWTVGDVCRKVAARTLAEAYYESLNPRSRELYVAFREPDFARNSERLKEWLDARPGKTLAELQADACEWAVQRLADRDEDNGDRWNDEDRDRWSAAIKKTAKALRAGGAPILSRGFGTEEFMPYVNKSQAE